MTLRVFSSGGGVQSTAALVLSAQGVIDFPIHLFCNVGEDSENPDTLAYVRDVLMLYAKANGIEFIELHRTRRNGDAAPTLYEVSMNPAIKGVQIPMRMGRGGQPARRHCTVDYKIKVSEKWLKSHGATKDNKAVVGLGISLDEFQRMRTDDQDYQIREYPLIDMRLTRQDCMNIVERAGLSAAPKSRCWFCPFQRLTDWQQLEQSRPDLFQKAVELERSASARNTGKDQYPFYLTDRKRPLPMAVAEMPPNTLDSLLDDNCESGYCMV